MSIYLEIIKFNLLKYLTYPFESIALIITRLITLALLILFWSVFSKSASQVISITSITGYFLISGAVNELVFARDFKFGRSIQKAIRSGQLNNYILKPIGLLPHLFSSLFIGGYGLNLLIAVVYLIIGIIIKPPATWLNILFFLCFFLIAISISLAMNLFIACIQFYTIEGGGVKNVLSHISRILSGVIVPIYYFPLSLRRIVQILPFSTMIYGPTNALQSDTITSDIWLQLSFGFLWAVLLPILALMLWYKALKNYDAIGI